MKRVTQVGVLPGSAPQPLTPVSPTDRRLHELRQRLSSHTPQGVIRVPGERRVVRVDLDEHGPTTQRLERE